MFYNVLQLLHRKQSRGFSLIEVLITSAIIGILTGVVLVRYNGFNSSVLLKNQAFELALAIREAQVFSVSIRGSSNQFRDPYGIHVDLSSGPTQTYKLFLDSGTGDDNYYVSGSDIDVETVVIDSRFAISDFCVTSGATTRCNSDTGNPGPDTLSVLFRRPNFDAKIAGIRNSASDFFAQDALEIILSTVEGNTITRTVFVNSTGQITVE